jgi:hypothetical protein
MLDRAPHRHHVKSRLCHLDGPTLVLQGRALDWQLAAAVA